MRYVNAGTAVALLALAALQLLWREDSALALPFALGAAVAALAATRWLGGKLVRLLAFLSAAVLFCFFWQFFSLVPTLQEDWYWQAGTLPALGQLFGGFGMIPVLSEYTCRMKANGNCERAQSKTASGTARPASLRAFASRQTT